MARELVKLTNTELTEKGSELANAVGELYTIRAEKTSAMNEFKTKIDDQELKIAALTMIIRTGEEIRERTFFSSHLDDE